MPTVKPEILVWAREAAGLTPEEAVKKLAIRDTKKASALDRLAAYESGADDPTRPLLVRMSKQYRRPLLTFYLPNPPSMGNRGADFRTLLAGDSSPIDAAHLDALIRDILMRQSLVRATLEDDDEIAALTFIGSRDISDGSSAVLSSLQSLLNMQVREYRAQPNANRAFNLLRARAESEGIFVLLKGDLGSYHSAIETETFRGFSISDDLAPFIVINDRDARPAWSFTLLHEMVHLILGQTGVSGQPSENQTERFCDDVASEYLLADREIEELELAGLSDLDDIAERIGDFSTKLNLSRAMVTYRAYRANAIKRDQYHELTRSIRADWFQQRNVVREQRRNEDTRLNPYVVRRHRLGQRLTSLVSRLLDGGELSTSRAAKILGVRPNQVQTLLSDSGRTQS